MIEEKWPYNLPIWRRSYRLASPDGTMTAEIAKTVEVSMSNPTIGTLAISTGLTVEDCNPSFIWSADSRYLAVPQYSRNWFWGIGKQRLVVIDVSQQRGWRSKKLAYYIQPEAFVKARLTVTIEPTRKAKTVIYDVSEILNAFEMIDISGKGLKTGG